MRRQEKAVVRRRPGRQTFRHRQALRKETTHDRSLDVTISRIGAAGDGIAECESGRLYVPLTVPGDRLRVRPRDRRGDGQAAELVEILVAGPGRVQPPCPHFGRCGGCSLQHLAPADYATWKVSRITESLQRSGLQGLECAPLITVPPGARRRVTFVATAGRRSDNGGAVVGFHTRRGHGVVAVPDCLVVAPPILSLVPALHTLLAHTLAPDRRAYVTITMLESGLDVVFDWPQSMTLQDREALAAFATVADVARLSWRSTAGEVPEPLVQRRPVSVTFAGFRAPLPPGGFLQATREGEEALIAGLVAAFGIAGSSTIPGAAAKTHGRVADLFSGAGTFTLPLAHAGLRVHAIDTDAELLGALTATRGIGGITTERRNLFTRPLTAIELQEFDAVVFDPPRAGARAQAEQLAGSTVPTVVAISCNPSTFARDARILAQGGYHLEQVTPIDQFLWSPHLELVACFRR